MAQPELLQRAIPPRQLEPDREAADGGLIILVGVEEVEEGIVQRHSPIHGETGQITVLFLLDKELVGTAAEEVDATASHQLEQPLVTIDLLHLESP